MTPVELSSLAAFRDVTVLQLVRMARVARNDTVSRGTRLFQSGQPCVAVALVADGCIRLCRCDAQGVDVTTGILAEGDFLGIASVSSASPLVHHDTAIALNRATLIWFPADLVIELASSSPSFLDYLLRHLTRRVNTTYLLGDIMARGSVSERLMFVLHHFLVPEAPGRPSTVVQQLSCQLSHEDLARLVGANRATVTRMLHALQADHRIELRRGHVHGIIREVVSGPSDGLCGMIGHHA